jgi:hypothetical protein
MFDNLFVQNYDFRTNIGRKFVIRKLVILKFIVAPKMFLVIFMDESVYE